MTPPPHAGARTAYIMSRFPKLTETFVLDEILALERLGCAVEVYPLLKERQRVVHPEAARLAERAHFLPFLSLTILAAQWYYLRQRPLAYFGALAEVLRGTFGSANFFIGALGIFPKSVCFARDMTRQGVTHVHAHFATHPAVAALVIHRLTGIPFSFTAHGSDLHVERRMLDHKVRAAAFAVTVSEYNKAIIVQECGAEARDKVHVIHCGVDPDMFSPVSPKTGGPLRVLCIGSLEEVKGHRYLIAACRLLRDQGVEFICELAGDGPLRRSVVREIARSGLQAHVLLHGPCSRARVALLLAEADVLALASVPTRGGKREGIPVVLMEGMASALPVVASALSGIPELVEDGRTGLLVPPRDPHALATALRTLHADPALRARLGRAGREKVLAQFNVRGSALRLAALFDGAVTDPAVCC